MLVVEEGEAAAWSRSLLQEEVVGGSPVGLQENRRPVEVAVVEKGDCPWWAEEESWWAGVAAQSSWQPEEEEEGEEEGLGLGVEEEGPQSLAVEEAGHCQSSVKNK